MQSSRFLKIRLISEHFACKAPLIWGRISFANAAAQKVNFSRCFCWLVFLQWQCTVYHSRKLWPFYCWLFAGWLRQTTTTKPIIRSAPLAAAALGCQNFNKVGDATLADCHPLGSSSWAVSCIFVAKKTDHRRFSFYRASCLWTPRTKRALKLSLRLGGSSSAP